MRTVYTLSGFENARPAVILAAVRLSISATPLGHAAQSTAIPPSQPLSPSSPALSFLFCARWLRATTSTHQLGSRMIPLLGRLSLS